VGRARIRLKTTANPFSWFETLVDSRKLGGFWDDGLFRNMLMLIVGDVALLHLGLYGSWGPGDSDCFYLSLGVIFCKSVPDEVHQLFDFRCRLRRLNSCLPAFIAASYVVNVPPCKPEPFFSFLLPTVD